MLFRSFGRGAGVYCSKSDFFFEYSRRGEWTKDAEQVTKYRRFVTGDDEYVCNAPDMNAVCICHLDNRFPYNILHEVTEVAEILTSGNVRFREAFSWECKAGDKAPDTFVTTVGVPSSETSNWVERFSRSQFSIGMKPYQAFHILGDEIAFFSDTREDAVRVQNAMDTFEGATGSVMSMAQYLNKHIGKFVEPPKDIIGKEFNVYKISEIPDITFLDDYDEYEDLGDDDLEFIKEEVRKGNKSIVLNIIPSDLTVSSFIRLSDVILVPSITPGMQPRVVVPLLTDEIKSYSWYEDEGRYFMVDTGRTWMDIDTKEIDHIYNCQNFTHHDRWFIYAMKGRTLFRVGEMDTHQMTLFFEGYGGCGKSTVVLAQQRFHPSHRRGVLSANIEPLFGMSQVMKEGEAEVIYCNEAASELNLKQEEWQVSTSGEIAS